MAKKKKAEESEKNKFGEDLVSNEIASKYKENIKRGTEVLEGIRKKKIISFSPALDSVIGGGVREGTVIGIAGPPKVGKTTAVLHFLARCQKQGKKCVYLNTEGRMNSQNFDGIKDLNPEELIIVESGEKEILSGDSSRSL